MFFAYNMKSLETIVKYGCLSWVLPLTTCEKPNICGTCMFAIYIIFVPQLIKNNF